MTINPYVPSGGGSVDSKYEIKVDNSSDKGVAETHVSKADKGDKVIITVDDLDKGHRVVQIIVKDKNGNEIVVNRKDATTYEFVMPNSAVTVVPVYGLSAARPEESGVGERLNADDHIAFMVGDDKGNFCPNDNITRAEFATIVNSMLGRIGDMAKIDAGHGRQFPDVDKSHWGWYEIGEATYAHDHTFDSDFIEETWHD